MAATPELPSEERVRVLTADPELSADDANRHGDQFAQAGKFAQALMFYERTRDRGRLEALKKGALQAGDAFVLHNIARLAPDLVTEPEWKAAGDRAFQEGKLLFARDCYEKAGDAEKAKAAREEWMKIFPQPPPTSSPAPA